MNTHPEGSQAAQILSPKQTPSELDGRSTSDNDVRDADINEVEPDDPDVAGDDGSDEPS